MVFAIIVFLTFYFGTWRPYEKRRKEDPSNPANNIDYRKYNAPIIAFSVVLGLFLIVLINAISSNDEYYRNSLPIMMAPFELFVEILICLLIWRAHIKKVTAPGYRELTPEQRKALAKQRREVERKFSKMSPEEQKTFLAKRKSKSNKSEV